MTRQVISSLSRKPGVGTGRALLDLRILATSDLHANLLAWDYHSNEPNDQRGLARVATLIHAARAQASQSLLFDNGDFLHGTALGDFLAETTPALRSGRPLHTHPVIAAMNVLKYDAATLGNHEFGHGLGFLRRSLAALRLPVVCSNLYFKPTRGAPLAEPMLLLERTLYDREGRAHSVKIGVLGFLPPQTMVWERRYLKSRASVDDIVSSAQTLVPMLRGAGADLVVALSHSGINQSETGVGSENASSALAQIDGIDVVIAGHTHLLFPTKASRDLHGKAAVMPGFFGSHLGVIDLTLQKSGTTWRVAAQHSEIRPISRRDPGTGSIVALVKDDPAIVAIAMPAHLTLQTRAETPIGVSPVPLHSYFALLTATPALRLVARAQASRLRQVLAGSLHDGLPILSAVAPFKAGGRGGPENYTNIPAGILRARHAADLYLHPNSLSGLRVSGADLALWLERSVSLYHQIAAGSQDAPLIDERFPSFNFDVIDGLTYDIDLSQPAQFDPFGRRINPDSQRIVGLMRNGIPLRPEQEFLLATNSYRSAGGAGFAGAHLSQSVYEGSESNRDVLAAYLKAGHQPEFADTIPAWRFLVGRPATVLFDTAPGAVDHMQDIPHLRPEPLALLASGFRRFRLHL